MEQPVESNSSFKKFKAIASLTAHTLPSQISDFFLEKIFQKIQ